MPKILVVDDEEQIRTFMRLALWSGGHDVETAATAHAAMEKIRANGFDLVLSDVDMPEIDGHALAAWIAKHYPKCRVALMTGHGNRHCEICPYFERCPLILKPFDLKAVLAFVNKVLTAPPRPLTG